MPRKEAYVCPACASEGNPQPQPRSAFYEKPRKAGDGVIRLERSYLCRRHTDQENMARHQARFDPESPLFDEAYHSKVQQWKRDWNSKRLTPGSPDYDPELHERQKEAKRKYAQRRRDEAKQK
jgi:hypothetical protein